MGDQSDEELLELRAIIKGSVQGVFFRATTKKYAEKLGITGTVRNVPDGSVEIYAQGARERLQQFLRDLVSDQGPGKVQNIDKDFSKPTRHFSDFRIRY